MDVTDFPRDGLVHSVVVDVRINPGRIRMWIDDIYKGESWTTTAAGLKDALWSQSGDGGYGTLGGGATVAGEVTTNFNGALVSNLRFYSGQLVRYF